MKLPLEFTNQDFDGHLFQVSCPLLITVLTELWCNQLKMALATTVVYYIPAYKSLYFRIASLAFSMVRINQVAAAIRRVFQSATK